MVAGKEVILCVTGGMVRAATQPMKVGDWVVIGDYRGEVLEQNLFTIRLLEIGKHGSRHDYSGRTVSLPNSIFFTTSVVNENFLKRYMFHSFSLTVPLAANLAAIEQTVVHSIDQDLQPTRADAMKDLREAEMRLGIDLPNGTTTVDLRVASDSKAELVFGAFMPTDRAHDIEQKALRAVLPLLSGPPPVPSSEPG